MKVLCLGPHRKDLESFLSSQGDEPIFTEEPLKESSSLLNGTDFLVSFGYRHVLSEKVLALFSRRAVNIHISYLPWNRGADPNLWSFLEDTPKGVSIHYLSGKLDGGDILSQEKADLSHDETLRTSYERLIGQAERLFEKNWPLMKAGKSPVFPQKPGGSFHRIGDSAVYKPLLQAGWDTPVRELVGKAVKSGRAA